MKSYGVTIQMKPLQQYFFIVGFSSIFYKMKFGIFLEFSSLALLGVKLRLRKPRAPYVPFVIVIPCLPCHFGSDRPEEMVEREDMAEMQDAEMQTVKTC